MKRKDFYKFGKRTFALAGLTIWLASLLALGSCTDSKELEAIRIDFSNVQEILVDTTRIIHLETTDNSLLYDIGRIEILDDKFFVFSRNVVKVFGADGKFLFQLSGRGQGPSEYSSISNFFLNGKFVSIYDFNTGKILNYDSNGDFVNSNRFERGDGERGISLLFRLNEHTYLAKNSYAGEDFKVPVFSLLDTDLKNRKMIGGRHLNTGMKFEDACYVDENQRILYWEPVKDTLFSVMNESLEPLYKIDFGEYAIPEDVARKDDYDRVMFLSKEEGVKYAAMARYFQVSEGRILFSFIYDKIYLCSYDERTKDTRVYSFKCPDDAYKAYFFFKVHNGNIYIEMQHNKDMERNHVLYKFPIEDLYEKKN